MRRRWTLLLGKPRRARRKKHRCHPGDAVLISLGQSHTIASYSSCLSCTTLDGSIRNCPFHGVLGCKGGADACPNHVLQLCRSPCSAPQLALIPRWQIWVWVWGQGSFLGPAGAHCACGLRRACSVQRSRLSDLKPRRCPGHQARGCL